VKQTSRNVLLGLTTLAGLIGLAALLMLFGELDAIFKPRYVLTIRTGHAAGLRSGSAIELNGVPIGVVDQVLPAADPAFPVRIIAHIDAAARIPTDAVPYATASLLGGSAALQLEGFPPEVSGPGSYLPTDGTASLSSRIGIRLIEQIRSEFASNFSPIVELARNLNELVRAPPPGDPEAARASLRTTVAGLNEAVASLETTLERFRQTLDGADGTLREWKDLAGAVRADAEEVTRELLPALEGLSALLEETRQLASTAAHGQGTVAQLLNNPDLYRSVVDALRSLDRVLNELTLLVDELRREGIQVNL
jgi:ABC-type transporter Mla subunit MlaD